MQLRRAPASRPPIKGRGPLPKESDRKVPYPLSHVSKKRIEEGIADGTIKEEELPEIYRIALAVAATHRRQAPTLTDLETSIIFRTSENLGNVARGESAIKIIKYDFDGKPIMDPRKMSEHWKALARAVVMKLEEATSSSPQGA